MSREGTRTLLRFMPTRLNVIGQSIMGSGWSVLLVVIGCCAIMPAAALATTVSSSAGGALDIVQSTQKSCLSTPAAKLSLSGPVSAGDDLLLAVTGQGYGSAAPVVNGVSDPVNGEWSALVNDKSRTLGDKRYLSYAVYQATNAKAAPSGVTVTVDQKAGQSAAGAVLLDVGGALKETQVELGTNLQKSSNNTLTSPSATGAAGDLAVGLFGAYNMGQTFSAGTGWTLASTAGHCTRAVAESEPVSKSTSMTANASASSWTNYIGGLVTFAASASPTLALLPVPPVNTARPTIGGTPREGSALTADPGSWTGSPTSYTYQWQDCDGLLCSNISGGTGSSYTLQASDLGKTIDVVVTAANAGGSTSAVSGQTSTVQTPPPPANTTLPTITGSARQGQTLTASTGSWSNSPSSYAYQWQDCSSSSSCSNVSGATSSSYVLQSSDVGKTIDVVVTATNAGGSTVATSAQTSTVEPPAPADTAAPAVSGTAQQGQTLTASTGSWSNSPSSYAYQWQDCSSSSSCSNVSGATSSSYVLQSSDVGKTIDVVVTATNAGGSTVATSAQTSTVEPPAPADTAAPAVSGTAQQGQTLTASTGSWSNSPSSYAYQWQDCSSSSSCSNVSGATSSSYVLQSSDVGKTIDVVVTAKNGGGSGSATSAQTGTVQPPAASPPVNTAAPAVSGTAQQGQTLAASTGSWSNSPSSYAYQWQDCSSSSSCSNVSGATSSSYVLQSSDVGKTIDVVVTASNGGGSASKASAQTGVVTSASTGGGGGHQVFANYLGWGANLGSNLPWNDVTQFVMFALDTENGTGLNASQNEVSSYNLPNWTAMIHSHGDQAFIAIGGSNDENWQNACDSTNQAGFVTNLVNYIVSNGFDGVDLDIEQSGNLTASQLEGCVQAIATAAHAATTEQGKTPIVAEEMDESLYNSMPYSTIQYDISYLDQVQLEYFGYNPDTDWNCGTGSPANTCAYVTQMVAHATNQGIPADKLLLGMDSSGGYAQGKYSTLGTTTSGVNTTSGTPSSIPVSSISSAISAGDIVLATTENPPAHYQVLTTSGAAACSSNCSIPITGEVYGNGGYAFPSGSDVQSAYAGPWDCYNMGNYAATHGLKGNMMFDLQDDESGHNGSFACSDQIGLGLGF